MPTSSRPHPNSTMVRAYANPQRPVPSTSHRLAGKLFFSLYLCRTTKKFATSFVTVYPRTLLCCCSAHPTQPSITLAAGAASRRLLFFGACGVARETRRLVGEKERMKMSEVDGRDKAKTLQRRQRLGPGKETEPGMRMSPLNSTKGDI